MCTSDYMQTNFFYLRIFLKKLVDDQCCLIPKDRICHQPLCTYNILPWKRIDLKLDVLWRYLLCIIFADTAFLLGTEYVPSLVY